MLKPVDQPEPPDSERPVGELVHQLVEEGKAYASSELALAKAIALGKGRALAWPAVLFLAALIVVQSAVTILAVGIFMALLRPLGPILAAVVAALIYSAVAGALAWYGLERLKRDL